MTKRLLLLNLCIGLACFYVARTVYLDFQEYNETHRAMTVDVESVDAKGSDALSGAADVSLTTDPSQFAVISDKNLFLESRSIQAPAATPVVETVPTLNPKPGLLGIVQVGTERRAFVQNIRAQPGQRPTRTLRVGEFYEGFRVSRIERTRVELTFTSASGNVSTTVLDLHDQANRANRVAVKTPVAQSQVITVGAQPANQPGVQPAVQSAVQPAASGQMVDEQGRRIIRTPFGDIVQGAQGNPGGAAVGAPTAEQLAQQGRLLLQQEQQLQQQQQRPNTQPRGRNEIIDEQGRRIIRTPFGDIVRPPDPQPTPPPPPPPLD